MIGIGAPTEQEQKIQYGIYPERTKKNKDTVNTVEEQKMHFVKSARVRDKRNRGGEGGREGGREGRREGGKEGEKDLEGEGS